MLCGLMTMDHDYDHDHGLRLLWLEVVKISEFLIESTKQHQGHSVDVDVDVDACGCYSHVHSPFFYFYISRGETALHVMYLLSTVGAGRCNTDQGSNC